MNHSHDHHEHPSSLSLPTLAWLKHRHCPLQRRRRPRAFRIVWMWHKTCHEAYPPKIWHRYYRYLKHDGLKHVSILSNMAPLGIHLLLPFFLGGGVRMEKQHIYIYIFERVVVQVSAAHFSEAVSRNCSWNRFQMMNSKQIKLSSLRESDLKATGWNHGFFFGAISIFWWLQLG